MKLFYSFILVLALIIPNILEAQTRKNIETSTDILMFATPISGFIGSLALKDYQGTKQVLLSGVTNLAVCYALKYTIKKERPNQEDQHAFPSNHTSVSFQGATFLQRRYGWKFGLPAYLLSGYISWGRVYCKQHDWWDVLGGAVIGTASSWLFTRPLKKKSLTLQPTLLNGQYPGFYAQILL